MSVDKTVIQDQRELKGWLVIMKGQWQGKDFPLFLGKNTVGSSHYADIRLTEPSLEPFHFSIRFNESDVFITDLDSDSGIYIDTNRIFRKILEDETQFEISAADNDTKNDPGETPSFLVKLL